MTLDDTPQLLDPYRLLEGKLNAHTLNFAHECMGRERRHEQVNWFFNLDPIRVSSVHTFVENLKLLKHLDPRPYADQRKLVGQPPKPRRSSTRLGLTPTYQKPCGRRTSE